MRAALPSAVQFCPYHWTGYSTPATKSHIGAQPPPKLQISLPRLLQTPLDRLLGRRMGAANILKFKIEPPKRCAMG